MAGQFDASFGLARQSVPKLPNHRFAFAKHLSKQHFPQLGLPRLHRQIVILLPLRWWLWQLIKPRLQVEFFSLPPQLQPLWPIHHISRKHLRHLLRQPPNLPPNLGRRAVFYLIE